MAHGVLSPTAGGIINLLGPLAAEEIKLLFGVEDEVEKLKDTVSTIEKVLLQAEELRAPNPAIEEWLVLKILIIFSNILPSLLGRLSDVIYKAEDLLDIVSTEALRQEIMRQGETAAKVRKRFSKVKQFVFRHKVAHKIRAFSGKLQALVDHRKFLLDESATEARVMCWGRDDTYSYLNAKVVIGRDADKEAIISLMNTSVEGNISILPIVGIGGLGKTALAKLIFNDEKIKEKRFELKIWICVSNNFDVKITVKTILEETKMKPKNDSMNQLVEDLKNAIYGKNYLLVLDDVWNEHHEKWSKLIDPLMVDAFGSIILVTTCSLKVAKSTIKPYVLKGLGEEDSWKLFKMIAFLGGQELENSGMVNVGKHIIKKCASVSLVVQVVGNLLNIKYSKAKWVAFRDNEFSENCDI